jgi:transcriptional regulator with XRE-family HTH domain
MALDEKALGKVLQKARQQAGFTQQKLCQKTGLSYSTLAKIERGAIKAPSIFTIQQIAHVLGVTLDDLVGDAKSPHTAHKSTGIQFIYFDINGCLVRFFHRAFTALADELDISADVVEMAFWRYNDAFCRGQLSLPQFNAKLAKALKQPSVDWERHYLKAVEPIAAMSQLVEEVAQHYKVGLLSNIGPGLVDTMLKHRLLPSVPYAAIVDSSKEGVIKPELKIYEIAQAKAEVPAQTILLVDDTRANLARPQTMGWRVMWFNDYDPEQSIVRLRKSLDLH